MADYKGLNIRFRGDTTDAAKALNILSNEARTAQGNLAGIQNALKNTETNGKNLNAALKQFQLDSVGKQADAARGKFTTYAQTLEELKAKHAELTAEIESTKAALDGTGEMKLFPDGTVMSAKELAAHLNSVEEQERKTSAAIEDATRNMHTQQSAAQALEAQYKSMSATLAASQTSLYQMGENAVTFGNNLQSVGNALSSVGDKLTLVSTVAAVTFGRNVISSTEEFGNAISQLGGYLDIQGEQLESMSDQALKWGKDTQFSATEAAQAMNELAKGGMTQAQISGGAMKATMELAAAGELDMASAAEVAVQAIKTFGLEAEDSSAIADALAGAANKSTAEVTDLANGFKYVGGWASMAGWDINDVSGALALLSDHGLRGEMAGTALRNVMQRLAAPTNTAAKLMEQYGFSVRDSSGQMVSATEVVKRLNDTFGQLGDEEKQNVLSNIFGARALPAAIALMDEGEESLQGYIDATTQVGYASEMAQNRMGELGWALEFLRGEAETAAVNFGTALTPTIKGVAESIEKALEWFNSLSDAQKTNIANAALMVAATGPVISIVGHLASGIGGLVSMVGTGAKTIQVYSELMKGGGDSTRMFAEALAITTTPMSNTADGMQKVAEKASMLEKSFGTLATGVGVAAIVYAVNDAFQTISGIDENIELVRSATDGIAESMNDATLYLEGYTSATQQASEATATLQGTLEATNSGLESAAEYARETSETITSIGSGAGIVDEYARQIKELSDQSYLTAAQQELLRNAVDEYNDATGASIEITDALSGTLNILPSEIDEVTEAYKRQAEQQAYLELYNDAIKAQAENEQQLAQVTKQMGDAAKDASSQMKTNFDVISVFQNAHVAADVAKLEQSFVGLKRSGEELGDSVDYWRQKIESIGDSGYQFSSLEAAMTAAGVTGAQYSQLTQAQLAELEAAFDGTIGSISAKLQSFGIAVGGIGQQGVSDMTSMMDDAMEDFGTSVGGGIDSAAQDAQKAQKRANDAIYKEQQRAFDREYKALQKSLDAAYKAQQKAFDNEYKALQKNLDAAYDERKKALDASYDELKKALDKELEALKKANDATLKERKKADEAETKAFKAETDKRVKALQDEYKAKLKLLEAESGTDAIDDQIKAIENQTKAEKAEIKKREQQEKVSELQRAVEQAKTRRKRADAEAALTEYIEELAQEQRESERDAQIESLKEQKEIRKENLSDAKDALKEEYDAKIAALKESREAELEVLKETNDLQYDQLKERLDAEYDARKEANDSRLEQAKDANDAELAAMKESHSAQLESLKNAQSAQLEAMKEAQQEQLQNLKESQQDQLQDLRNSLDDQLEAVKSGGAAIAKKSKDTNDEITKNKATTNQKLLHDEREFNARYQREHSSALDQNLRDTASAADNIVSEAYRMVYEVEGALDVGLSVAASAGRETGMGYSRGIEDGGASAVSEADYIADAVYKSLDAVQDWTETSGWNLGINFANGISRTASYGAQAAADIASSVAAYLHHSVPEKGAMRDDDTWGSDMVMNIVDGMRSKESELATQSRRMAQIVSDEFNTDASARYSIDYDMRPMTKLLANGVTEALRSGIPQRQGVTVVVNEMNVRSESDIRRVSEGIYALAANAERRGW